jgi:hypothetical protein
MGRDELISDMAKDCPEQLHGPYEAKLIHGIVHCLARILPATGMKDINHITKHSCIVSCYILR